MLANRVFYNGFYILSKKNHFYALLYHALIHKNTIKEDYIAQLKCLGYDMYQFNAHVLYNKKTI